MPNSCVILAVSLVWFPPIKIDFEWIGFVKLNLVISELNVKEFMFIYIHVKWQSKAIYVFCKSYQTMSNNIFASTNKNNITIAKTRQDII
jgi:hypothetical protein